MEFNIVDFLPKYPSIEENNNGTYNENFNLSIYKKKEFYEERLTAFEDFPTSSGMLLKHQKIISRFLCEFYVNSAHKLYICKTQMINK